MLKQGRGRATTCLICAPIKSTNPINAVCETPPDYMRNKHEDWQKAWALRSELDQ